MTAATQSEHVVDAKAESQNASRGRSSTPIWRACALGLVLFLAFFLTGNGLGASGGLNRMIIWVIDLVAPQHVDRVSYLIDYAGGDKNALDHWIVLMTVGIFMGGLDLRPLSGGACKFETIRGPRITDHQRWMFALTRRRLSLASARGWRAVARLGRGCLAGRCSPWAVGRS